MIDAAVVSAIRTVLSPERLAAVVPLHAAWQHHKPTGDARRDRLQSTLSSRRWHATHETLSTEFGAACGWKRGRRFTPMQLARGGPVGNREDVRWCYRGTTLAWDHVEYFRRRRVPAAILVHVYDKAPWLPCQEFAAAHGLAFMPLPWSWYFPHGTAAGLYLRPLADVIPLRRCV